ncbi:ArsR/SmtB family transcription factor [Marinomonas colpomeniae]|uniref:MarR family transcriptional regulator n=1 Tax=Marinomonas colpomeniae TaxID=2774408 RepID=A0ABR8NYY7_9GAMM|nr:MarR family transcriptional regulator [Marinomonas colpomeniae]MBD5770297.1 MarR family transcriptional regulator [Marinomonas colpomeniae]
MQIHNNIPLYTPSILAPETLQAMFVKRDALLTSLYNKHKSSVLENSKHFSLIVGPRGMGKTHLISMLYHKLKQDHVLKKTMLLTWLREEEWGISSYLDLLIQILRNLENDENSIDLSTIDVLYELGLTDAEYQAEKLIENLLVNKVLVILAENLNLIFDGLGTDDQEKLRAFIQNTGKVTIAAATQSLFASVTSRSKPFYGFFTVTHLEKFTLKDAIQLLLNIAKRDKNEALIEVLNTEEGQARIRALHHLAGGSPRIYVLFSQFIQADTLNEFTEPMMKMLDELTPYYQAKMLDISAQQRKLIMCLCRESGAVTVQTLAKKNHISPQTASSQLKKLKASGFVESTQYGRQSYYEIAEPLLRMVLSVKDNRGAPIKLAIDLIRHFYTTTELKQIQSNEKIDLLGIKFLTEDLINSAINNTTTSPHVTVALKDFEREFKKENYQETHKIIEQFYQFNKEEKAMFSQKFSELLLNFFSAKTTQLSLLKKLFSSLPSEENFVSTTLIFLYTLRKKEKTVTSKQLFQSFDQLNLFSFPHIAIACLHDIKLTLDTIVFTLDKRDQLITHIVKGSTGLLFERWEEKTQQIELLIQLVDKTNEVDYISSIIPRLFINSDQYSKEDIEVGLKALIESKNYKITHMIQLIVYCCIQKSKIFLESAKFHIYENEKFKSIIKETEAISAYLATNDPSSLLIFPKEIRSFILSEKALNE